MRQQLERGWNQRRVARELGISRHTVSRYQKLGDWQPYDSSKRAQGVHQTNVAGGGAPGL